MVDQLPHLLYASFTEQKKEDAPQPPGSKVRAYQERHAKEGRTKKTVLLTGVICITLIIIIMWIWNMQVFWYRTQELTKEQPKLWDETKKDLSDILDSATTQKESVAGIIKEINAAEEEKGKEALSDAFNSLMIATSSPETAASTTPPTVTSTTTTSTNSNQP